MNWSEPLGEITAKKSIKWLQTLGYGAAAADWFASLFIKYQGPYFIQKIWLRLLRTRFLKSTSYKNLSTWKIGPNKYLKNGRKCFLKFTKYYFKIHIHITYVYLFLDPMLQIARVVEARAARANLTVMNFIILKKWSEPRIKLFFTNNHTFSK